MDQSTEPFAKNNRTERSRHRAGSTTTGLLFVTSLAINSPDFVMSDSDFFDSVFDEPEDDPLLGNESESSEEHSSSSERYGAPSWMDDVETSDQAGQTSNEPEQKKIVVDQRGDSSQKLDALNQAIKQGWEVVRLSLHQSAERGADQKPRQFVALLEKDSPTSLFDF